MILNRCTCEETQAALGTTGPCSFCHAGGGDVRGVTAPLDLEAIKRRLEFFGNAPYIADDITALVAEVERLTRQRDHLAGVLVEIANYVPGHRAGQMAAEALSISG